MQIFVRVQNGKTLTLDVEPDTTIEEVKTQIEDKENILPSAQRLVFACHAMEDSHTLSDYNVPDEAMIHLVRVAIRGGMQIYVCGVSDKKWAFEVEPSTTVEEVKAQIEDKEGIPAGDQSLAFGDNDMEDGHTLSDYKVTTGAELRLALVKRQRQGRFPGHQPHVWAVAVNIPLKHRLATRAVRPQSHHSVTRSHTAATYRHTRTHLQHTRLSDVALTWGDHMPRWLR